MPCTKMMLSDPLVNLDDFRMRREHKLGLNAIVEEAHGFVDDTAGVAVVAKREVRGQPVD